MKHDETSISLSSNLHFPWFYIHFKWSIQKSKIQVPLCVLQILQSSLKTILYNLAGRHKCFMEPVASFFRVQHRPTSHTTLETYILIWNDTLPCHSSGNYHSTFTTEAWVWLKASLCGNSDKVQRDTFFQNFKFYCQSTNTPNLFINQQC